MFLFKQIALLVLGSSSLFSINVEKFINHNTCDAIVDKKFYKACFNYKFMGTTALFYSLEGDKTDAVNIKKRPSFHTEKSLPQQYRVSPKSYVRSGYDRGHLASDAGFDWSMESLSSTYSMVNIVPQTPKVNRRYWSRAERYSRIVAKKLKHVNILNIIKYEENPKRLLKQNIAVPSGFYKIIFNNEKNFERCFYYDNDLTTYPKKDKLKYHLIDCSEVV